MIYAYLTLIIGLFLYLLFSSYRLSPNIKARRSHKKRDKKESGLKDFIYKITDSKDYRYFRSYVSRKLKEYPVIRKITDTYTKRISIIDSISEEEAARVLEINILSSLLTMAASFAISLLFLKVIYLAFIFSVSIFYVYWHRFNTKIKIGIHEIENSFPNLVQSFIDEYVVSKNSKNALISIMNKAPEGSTKMLFEKLIREIYSGTSWEDSINEFSHNLNFFYAQAFSEILKLSLTKVGDISEELNDLMDIMQDDIQQKEQTKSTVHENKVMFYIVNAVTLSVVILNILFHPFAKEIYSYTAVGSALLSFWILQIMAGVLFIEASENI